MQLNSATGSVVHGVVRRGGYLERDRSSEGNLVRDGRVGRSDDDIDGSSETLGDRDVSRRGVVRDGSLS